MVRKEFTFKGKKMNELLAMSLEEFAKLAGSKIYRKVKRGFVDKRFVKMIEKAHDELKAGKYGKPIRTHLRSMFVFPKMVGLKIAIHKGNEFQITEITEKMLGHRLGELAMTRKRLMHGKAGIGATRSSTAITARK